MSSYAGISGQQLRQIIERIEYLEDQKANVAADIREVFSEAKGSGFDVKIVRQILKLRKIDHDERQEQEALLETYLAAMEHSQKARDAEKAMYAPEEDKKSDQEAA